jgi:signal transduction histidine kinase
VTGSFQGREKDQAAAATMNTMLERIEASAATQRRFAADASHELRSPLTTIRANADLLAGVDIEEKPARSVERIRTESARMSRLVEDLLLLARVDDRQAPGCRGDVDLDDSRSRQGGGAGLGLAIARDIITLHQGSLTVDDLFEGAAMRVRIPTALQ